MGSEYQVSTSIVLNDSNLHLEYQCEEWFAVDYPPWNNKDHNLNFKPTQ